MILKNKRGYIESKRNTEVGEPLLSASMRNAVSGYDPQWIDGFNKFVEGGLRG